MMKQFLFSLWAASLSLTACSQSGMVESRAYDVVLGKLLDHSVPEMDVEQLHAEAGSFVLVDARERAEYDVSHLPGAVWSGYDDFDPERLSGIPRSEPVVVYCSVGYRSEKIAEKLKAAGFGDVYNLYGGIFEWKNRGYEVVDPDGEPTGKVHAYDRTWGRWLKAGEKVYSE